MKREWIYILLLIAPVVVTSCSSEGCDTQDETFLMMSLYESNAEIQQMTDSITVWGSGMSDSLIYDMASTDNLLLQPDPGVDNCSYIIINGTIADTVSISYKSNFHFISKSCGYTYFFDISNVTFTRNWIDTILIINSEIKIPENENLRTFY